MVQLSKLDLVFCVDLTSSMSGFITAAKQHHAGMMRLRRRRLLDGIEL